MAVEGRLIIAFVMFCSTLFLIAVFFIVRRKKEKAFNYEEKLRAKIEQLEQQQDDDVLKPLNVTRFVYEVEKRAPTKMKIESLMLGESRSASTTHADELAVFKKNSLLQDHVTFNSHFNCFLTADNIEEAEKHGNIFRVGLRIERMHLEADVVDDEDYAQRITDQRKQARLNAKHARQGRDHLAQMNMLKHATDGAKLADGAAEVGTPIEIGQTALNTILGGGVGSESTAPKRKKKLKVTSGLELMVQESQNRRAAEDVVSNERVANEVAFMNPHDESMQSGDSSAVLNALLPRAIVERHLLDDDTTHSYHNVGYGDTNAAARNQNVNGGNPTQPAPLTSLVGSDALAKCGNDVSSVAGIVQPYAPVRSAATQPLLSFGDPDTGGGTLTASGVIGGRGITTDGTNHSALSASAASSARPLRVQQHGGEITHDTPVVTEPLTGALFTAPGPSQTSA